MSNAEYSCEMPPPMPSTDGPWGGGTAYTAFAIALAVLVATLMLQGC